VEVVQEPDAASRTLCVVADDRPGLFALVSAALAMNDLDVLEGEAHTREVPGMRSEAVDLFVVRHAGPARQAEPVGDEEASAVSRTIRALLSGELTTRTATRPEHAETRGVDTTVRFLENDFGALATLEVETGDRSGLLLALADALYQQKVQIIASEVRTVGNRVLDRFQIVELDGQAISQARRLEIQLAVLSAVA
jgi:[protein-PII] uridylyltransferase